MFPDDHKSAQVISKQTKVHKICPTLAAIYGVTQELDTTEVTQQQQCMYVNPNPPIHPHVLGGFPSSVLVTFLQTYTDYKKKKKKKNHLDII